MARKSHYTPEAGVLVARAVADGLSLRRIAALRIPRHHWVLSRWRREHPDFDRLLRVAERARDGDRAAQRAVYRPINQILAR